MMMMAPTWWLLQTSSQNSFIYPPRLVHFSTQWHQRLRLEHAWICALYKFCNNNIIIIIICLSLKSLWVCSDQTASGRMASHLSPGQVMLGRHSDMSIGWLIHQCSRPRARRGGRSYDDDDDDDNTRKRLTAAADQPTNKYTVRWHDGGEMTGDAGDFAFLVLASPE